LNSLTEFSHAIEDWHNDAHINISMPIQKNDDPSINVNVPRKRFRLLFVVRPGKRGTTEHCC